MKTKNIKSLFFYVLAVGVSTLLLFFIVACSWIGYEVKNQCQQAKKDYNGDCVESLISLLKDENQKFGSRNDAIWALGQLGDIRALPVLQSFYTGNIPPREPWDEIISQYELKKAINLANGGLNIGAWVWRGFL